MDEYINIFTVVPGDEAEMIATCRSNGNTLIAFYPSAWQPDLAAPGRLTVAEYTLIEAWPTNDTDAATAE
jgi:hypothetical protein